MDKMTFEQLVSKAIESLPDEFAERLENVEIVVRDQPTHDQRRQARLRRGQTLFGLYEGVPLTERDTHYSLVLPDRITIFQRPIESNCGNEADITAEIRSVIQHEIAHHFGLSDERLEELGR